MDIELDETLYSVLRKFYKKGRTDNIAGCDKKILSILSDRNINFLSKTVERIESQSMETGDRDYIILNTYYEITVIGNRKIEDYERVLETLELQRASVAKAEEANKIARTANRKSNLSLLIALLSALAAVAGVVVSVILSK